MLRRLGVRTLLGSVSRISVHARVVSSVGTLSTDWTPSDKAMTVRRRKAAIIERKKKMIKDAEGTGRTRSK
jgi:hypothetical protein